MIEQIDFDKDYEEYCAIFNQWEGWAAPSIDTLPDTTFVYKCDNKIVATGCLYLAQTGSFCMLEWFIVNRKFNGRVRNKAVNELMDFLIDFAFKDGFNYIFTTSNNKAYGSRLLDRGFIETDKNSINYIKIWEQYQELHSQQ